MSAPLRRRTFLAAAAGFLVACGAAPPKMPAPILPISTAHSADIEVGTGKDTFVPIQDGDTLQMQPGAQGCCHVWVSFKAVNVKPGTIVVRVGFYRHSDSAELVLNQYRLTLDGDGAQYEESGFFGFVPMVTDEDLDLRLELTDSAGRVLTDSRRIRLLPR